jgi:subtilisin family serine protease
MRGTYNRGKDSGGRRGPRIDVHRPKDDIEYMYRRDVVLTRDRDAENVYRVLGLRLPRDLKGTTSTPPAVGGLHVVPLPRGRDVHEALDLLDLRLGRGVATPDHVVHLCDASNCPATEPIPAYVWRPEPSADSAPDTDGRRAKVVVVDTGVLRRVVKEHDWLDGVTGDREPPSVGHYRGHGTFVAGVVRAMAPAATVEIEGLLYRGGAVVESDLAPALARALDTTPDIINLSAGTRTRNNHPLMSLQVFYEERLRHLKGTVVVAAAGNDGGRDPFWPAAFPWTLSVGALNTRHTRAGYSNFGSWVDVYARGSGIVNAYPTGVYRYLEPPRTGRRASFPQGMAAWSGTSFSTPIVVGLIAARMTWSGESARQAADSLMELARRNSVAGVGAVLEPGMASRPAANN